MIPNNVIGKQFGGTLTGTSQGSDRLMWLKTTQAYFSHATRLSRVGLGALLHVTVVQVTATLSGVMAEGRKVLEALHSLRLWPGRVRSSPRLHSTTGKRRSDPPMCPK